ncbi:MAG: SpoIIE family protein phosphatase [Clostridia bacterium]|nr:SpoIIE family protein phosphatase [Clostridia bacterium]
METLKKYALSTRRAVGFFRREHIAWEYIMPSMLIFPLAYFARGLNALLFLDIYVPAVPFAALAAVSGLWMARDTKRILPAALASLAGCAADKNLLGAVAVILLLALIGLLRGSDGMTAAIKCALSVALLFVLIPIGLVCGLWRGVDGEGYLAYICAAGVCMALMLACAHGFGALNALDKRVLTDEKLIALAVCAGMVIASLGRTAVFGIRLGVVMTLFFSLAAVRVRGAAGVAAAALMAICRVKAADADYMFIAVIASCALAAALVRPLGRIALAAAFALPAICFYVFMSGTGAPNFRELIIAFAAFLPIKESLTLRIRAGLTTERTEKAERRALFALMKLAMLAHTLDEIAELFPPDGAKTIRPIITGTAECLGEIASFRENKKRSIVLKCGVHCLKKDGSDAAGDSALTASCDFGSVAVISDGMGSGRRARSESQMTVSLFSKLVGCGFSPSAAAECANALLVMRERGEMYATLDAALIDPVSAGLVAVKHGAPPSYIIRGSTLYTLYSEALPIGAVEGAKPAVFRERLRAGDALIMMSDGVYDALGDALNDALCRAAAEADPTLGAQMLVLSALENGGGADDMTAVVVLAQARY